MRWVCSLWFALVSFLEWCYGCYFTSENIPPIVEKHRQNRGNTCRYSFDKVVVQIIAICAVLYLVLAVTAVTSFISIFLKNIKFVCFALCQF